MLPTPVYRRLGAIIYDLLLHVALWMIVAGTYTALVLKGQVLAVEHRWLLQVTLFPLLVLISYSFMSYFCLRNQSTLGMQAWKLKMFNQQGGQPSLRQITTRFIITAVTFGLGFVWCLFDRQKRSLQDIISPTRIAYCP